MPPVVTMVQGRGDGDQGAAVEMSSSFGSGSSMKEVVNHVSAGESRMASSLLTQAGGRTVL